VRQVVVADDPVFKRRKDGRMDIDWRTPDGRMPKLPILISPELLMDWVALQDRLVAVEAVITAAREWGKPYKVAPRASAELRAALAVLIALEGGE
jgi:hypothetical protein